MLERFDRVVLMARRRSRRRRRERELRALPGYVPASTEGKVLSGLRRRSVALTVAAVSAVAVLPAAGYGVAAEVNSRAAQSRYEVADRDYAEASAAYSAARAVEMEQAGVPEPDNAVEYLRMYSEPESATARDLQAEMDAATAEWSEAADET